ncbi:MAG: hypothetical protein UW11_C0027G0004 [Parcubacteria group bacterium GW2011_GWA2_43_9b]|uniref:Fumarate reductase subunit C n=1 Tax=Candidatus Portnoybacteria bacterium RIFCSPLOWO2_02_FULL_39_11 TaxID=1802001 RepID=A0A1G2FR57_9BACT|nr:MAG: hypothetical protein UW11_C0027G0004 [Parcubacteria group bacterium GW2011_GWA2_43_9b]OGZ40001.1 MAG: hypothetical protein A3B04_02910 [Candidatus Portnoybacteria bacterium RIFCSPLOWO2_02_FULL_39_11]
MSNPKLIFRSLTHSLGVFIYIIAVASLLSNANKMFGSGQTFWTPAFMLLLLVVSATITGALVLGKPILMYLDNQKSAAIKLFFYTIGWLAVITIAVLIILVIVK